MTDSRIGHIRYLGKILKPDIAQDQPRPQSAFLTFPLGRVEKAPLYSVV